MLHVGRQIPISVTLQNIIEKSFPEELAERRAELRASSDEPAASGRPESPVPLFVMCCLMPGRQLWACLIPIALLLQCLYMLT